VQQRIRTWIHHLTLHSLVYRLQIIKLALFASAFQIGVWKANRIMLNVWNNIANSKKTIEYPQYVKPQAERSIKIYAT